MSIIKKNIPLISGIFVLMSLLTACSSVTQSAYVQKAGLFPDRDAIYMKGQSMPPLTVPANIPPIPNDPYFVIPETSQQTADTVSLLPPGSLAATQTTKGSSGS